MQVVSRSAWCGQDSMGLPVGIDYEPPTCQILLLVMRLFFFQAEDGIRDDLVTGVQTCALPIPCLMTLSRSTWTNCCGTLGRKVVLKPAISGRFRAAIRNVCRLDARNSTSLPARSSSANVNPPEVPTPGIAGGENEKAIPSGICESSRLMRCLIS